MNRKDIQVGEQYYAGKQSLFKAAWFDKWSGHGISSFVDELTVEVVALDVPRTNSQGNDTSDGIEVKVLTENTLRSNPVVHARTLTESVKGREAERAKKAATAAEREAEYKATIAARAEGIDPLELGQLIKDSEHNASDAAADLLDALDSLATRVEDIRKRLIAGTEKYRSGDRLEGTGFIGLGRGLVPTENDNGVLIFPQVATSLGTAFNGDSEKAVAALGRYKSTAHICNSIQYMMKRGAQS